jgi:hypothetical protein
MKKFLVVLLSLGLLVAFGSTASAVDVKFGGSYYVAGVYENNQRLADQDAAFSRAFFYTRTRVQTVFEVAEGLSLTTRFDALEKQWGQTDWRGGFDDKNSSRRQQQQVTSAANASPKIQESFEFERAYVTFLTGIGVVQAGVMSSGKWGTDFGDDEQSRPRARIDGKAGNVNWGFVYEKEFEADTSNQAGFAGKADADADTYALYAFYNFKGGNAGLLYKFFDRRATRVTANARSKYHGLLPYFKVTLGPVYMEGEVVYGFGKATEFDSGTTPDKDIDLFGAYFKARMNLGPAYFGASVLYSQGDDLADTTKTKVGPQSQDIWIALILGNDELQTWNASSGNGYANGVGFDSGRNNAIMSSLFAGFNPTPKLNVEATLISAQRDTAAMSRNATTGVITSAVSKNMGIEVDVTAKYKIYDNLTYMVGAGYLWTGDYFKGSNDANKISNDYLLMNRLSLSF